MVQAVKAGDKKKETTGSDIRKTGQPDYKLLIDTAALAGTIMLENGAEIYRVEETINYILKTSGLKTSEAFVVSTGIMISLDDPSIDALTVIRRVNKDICTVFVVAFFAGMYGGDFKDMGATAIVGIFLAAWLHIGKKIALNPLINDLVASIVISVIAFVMVHVGIGSHIDRIIIGSIMVLVPGAAITNGDYASGNANILQAFTEAAMIALGVYVGLLLL